MNIREDFEDYQILEGTVKIGDNQAIAFGPIGTLEGEADIEVVEKKAEGNVIKTIKRVKKVDVTMDGHATVPARRGLHGMTTEGLKPGVYAYGSDIKSQSIVFTAKVRDMDGNIKYIAFPNMENIKGLTIKIDNDVTEIEMNEFEFSAMKDSNNKFFYEAFDTELEDVAVKSAWLTNFTPELVKETEE